MTVVTSRTLMDGRVVIQGRDDQGYRFAHATQKNTRTPQVYQIICGHYQVNDDAEEGDQHPRGTD